MVETKITSKKENKKVKSPSLSEIAEKEIGDLLKEKIVLKRVGFSITPELKTEFEESARSMGVNLTEFLRRAGRAAQHNPSILQTPEIEEAEAEYKDGFRPSRWTYEAD